MTHEALGVGFPRMNQEAGERRDFLPDLVAAVANLGCTVLVEHGIGQGMGRTDEDYLAVSGQVQVADAPSVFAQDIVVVLRSPDCMLPLMRPGATLVSMLHYPTRPGRVHLLHELGLEAISLDAIVDDEGRRLVENMRAVGWNGLEAAFDALSGTSTRLTDPEREPIRVTQLGAGTVGKHAIEAATKYGSLSRNQTLTAMGLPGVVVTVVGRNVSSHAEHMRRLLRHTDVLVDAAQRSDPSQALVPNAWLEDMPEHAVVCDLVVDPYLMDCDPVVVRGIEGIPAGDLDQWAFLPDDPRWGHTIPPGVPTDHRRVVVSCRAWPGIKPGECMHHYGRQLAPLLTTLVQHGGAASLPGTGGSFWERALRRASLRTWAGQLPTQSRGSSNQRSASKSGRSPGGGMQSQGAWSAASRSASSR
jgi:alanine dehydrogenase